MAYQVGKDLNSYGTETIKYSGFFVSVLGTGVVTSSLVICN